MTTLELQRALLAHYNLAKQRVQEAEGYQEAREIIEEMDVQNGACYCSRMVFGKFLEGEVWVSRNTKGPFWWGPTPGGTTTTKEQIIERLQLRIDILNKEINNHE